MRGFRRLFLVGAMVALMAAGGAALEPIPDKTVVLTFDDNVRSHLTFVAPLLQKHGFRATFFVTHKWMHDAEHFLNWEEIKKIEEMGFEIGNHSWTHANFNSPQSAAHLAGELALVDSALKKAGVSKPTTFGWTGNGFGPEALEILRGHGVLFARRGMQPEIPYGELELGPLYDPKVHDPLLIPSAGDAYPNWTLDHFIRVVERAKEGKVAVVQFHGVPDVVHPWVHTSPDLFRDCVAYLAEEKYNVIALADLARYVDPNNRPNDPMTGVRHSAVRDVDLPLPPEQLATRANLRLWAENMQRWHGYSVAEAAGVAGWSEKRYETETTRNGFFSDWDALRIEGKILALPYPGGRHPRIGFLDGAIDPMRGTKVSVFPPWEEAGYVVLDLPEAIFSNLGLTFLAHTHIPTIWDASGVWIENTDWVRTSDGRLEHEWRLPNGIAFGATVIPDATGVECEMRLRNGTVAPLSGMRTQVCAMLKGAKGFEGQTNDNKVLDAPVAATRSPDGRRWILKAFENCGRAWANPPCPCIHSDPVFPDAAPGETVRVRGRVWFYEGEEVEKEIAWGKGRFGR